MAVGVIGTMHHGRPNMCMRWAIVAAYTAPGIPCCSQLSRARCVHTSLSTPQTSGFYSPSAGQTTGRAVHSGTMLPMVRSWRSMGLMFDRQAIKNKRRLFHLLINPTFTLPAL
eukprot:356388-Chlamydomonas_euryale.AAC.3